MTFSQVAATAYASSFHVFSRLGDVMTLTDPGSEPLLSMLTIL